MFLDILTQQPHCESLDTATRIEIRDMIWLEGLDALEGFALGVLFELVTVEKVGIAESSKAPGCCVLSSCC